MNRRAWSSWIVGLFAYWAAGALAGCGDSDSTDQDADTVEAVDDGAADEEPEGEADSGEDAAPVDEDGDGYSVDEDCDDTDFDVHPGAAELCNGVDDDCDGETDEEGATDAPTWYQDVDGDTYGDPEASLQACEAPDGYVADGTDCDDANEEVHPGAPEVCNGTDDDCDGETDEEGATGYWYPDADGDTYGDDTGGILECVAPSGYVNTAGDCDDDDDAVNPAEFEACNGIDDNCDTVVDEGTALDAHTFYPDVDGDTYGDPSLTTAIAACPGLAPAGYVEDNTDCDDDDADRNPGETDVPDAFGYDANCDRVDGDVAHSIFVSQDTGTDTNDGHGTVDAAGSLVIRPVRSLALGMSLASAADAYCAGTCDVLVAVSMTPYNVGAAPLDLVPGVDVYGGYQGAGWTHDAAPDATVVTGNSGTAVLRAAGVTVDTVVGFLKVLGATVTTAGESSTAVLVTTTPAPDRLTFRWVTIEGGNGGPGVVGADGAVDSCVECPGGAGAWDNYVDGLYCDCTNLNRDASGATYSRSGSAGAATVTNLDGTSYTCPSPGIGGVHGADANCGSGCTCGGTRPAGTAGGPGTNGANATAGGARAAGSMGAFVSGVWGADPGGTGRAGLGGSGGGGGGALGRNGLLPSWRQNSEVGKLSWERSRKMSIFPLVKGLAELVSTVRSKIALATIATNWWFEEWSRNCPWNGITSWLRRKAVRAFPWW